MAYIRPYRGKWRAEVHKHGQRVSRLVESEDEAKTWAMHAEASLDASASRYKPREALAVAGSNLVTMVPRSVLDACRQIPHRQVDILAAAIPTAMASGVYFLIRSGEVVYVGQSLDVLHRIARHRREGRSFDAFSYLECPAEDMDRLEALYIKAFVPEGNASLGRSLGTKPAPR